ncbi:MAG TPA: hypothetical protein VK402_19295 [Blastococcus sp.]|nr:hypothetical protein [Blastococcus sp.]
MADTLNEVLGLPPDKSITAQFTNCSGGINTPPAFEAKGPETPTTHFQLTDGSHRVYNVKAAINLVTGETLKEHPVFDRTAANVVTCLTEGGEVQTWGILAPRGRH